MRSARIVSPGKIEIVEENTPEAGEKVLVRLKKAALCGSDLPYFSKAYNPAHYPFPSGYPGHECLGVVERPGASGFRAGDLVMYYPTALDAFKEFHVADPGRLQKLPAGQNLDVLLMTQLLGAVAHSAFRIDRPYNKSVLVMGAGPVGLLFISLMKNFGARRIIAVDPLDYRLEAAKKMGADIALNPASCTPATEVASLTAGAGADIVIDAYGQDTAVINACFDLACHSGQVAFFGICLEERPGLNFNVFFRKELRMVASVGPDLSVDYPYALDMILKGAVDVSPLITHVMPFERIQQGFETAVARADRVIKLILDF
ncbi:MAG: hypothetical protein EPN93_16985 [Spirochaetes bacterium]|nr:MAG: hypothetical protein EPN93_16985 [Spirochaetota bacterium]